MDTPKGEAGVAGVSGVRGLLNAWILNGLYNSNPGRKPSSGVEERNPISSAASESIRSDQMISNGSERISSIQTGVSSLVTRKKPVIKVNAKRWHVQDLTLFYYSM